MIWRRAKKNKEAKAFNWKKCKYCNKKPCQYIANSEFVLVEGRCHDHATKNVAENLIVLNQQEARLALFMRA